jgi:hypothetical protein
VQKKIITTVWSGGDATPIRLYQSLELLAGNGQRYIHLLTTDSSSECVAYSVDSEMERRGMKCPFNNLLQYSPGVSIQGVRRTNEIFRHVIPGPGFHLGISKYEAETLHVRSRRLAMSLNVDASYEIPHRSEIDVIPSSVAKGN